MSKWWNWCSAWNFTINT